MKSIFLLSLTFFCWTQSFGSGAMNLVPKSMVTDSVVQSGNWSDPATWGGSLPGNNARILIGAGHTVTVDGVLPTRHTTIRLEGKLRFNPSVTTELKVESMVGFQGSELEMGTAVQPISSGVTAKLLFIDQGPLDLIQDHGQFGKGLVTMGKVRMYGAEKTSWLALAVQPGNGDTELVLSASPQGWQVGDRLAITGTDRLDPASDEVAVITAINGPTISLSQALSKDHFTPYQDLPVHVANLSRNLILESENPSPRRRAHAMFMHTTDVVVQYARFAQMGRTDKRQKLDDIYFPTLIAEDTVHGPRTNIRGRYSLHFHRGGVDPNATPAASVTGCVVEDDPGWAYVNHSSHVNFTGNVSYNVVGGAFQTEAGDEIGAFVRNIAIRTVNPDFPLLNPATAPVDIREDAQDFAFQGDGFWLHGGGVQVDSNVASGCSGHGFIYWTEGLREVGTAFEDLNHFLVSNIPNGHLLPGLDKIDAWWVPLRSFKGNTSYSVTQGFKALYIHSTLFDDVGELTPTYLATVHSELEDMTIWNVRKGGVNMENCERFTWRNLRMVNDGSLGVPGLVCEKTVANRTIFERIEIEGFDIGMVPPMQGNISICQGDFSNRWDFRLIPPQRDVPDVSDNRDLRIDGIQFRNSPFFSPADIVHFKLEGAASLNGSLPEFLDAEEAHKYFLIPDRIVINTDDHAEMRLYYDEQAPNFVPVTSANLPGMATGSYVTDILNKSNQQLFNQLQMCFAGALMPSDATAGVGIVGGRVSRTDIQGMNYPTCHFIDMPTLAPDFFDSFDFYTCWDGAGSKVAGTTTPFNHSVCGTTQIAPQSNEWDEPCSQVYPNPTRGAFAINYQGSQYSLTVLSSAGEVLQSGQGFRGETNLDLSEVGAGLYFVRIWDEKTGYTCTRRLIKL